MGKTLFQKVWNDHVVQEFENNQHQLFIGLHLIHEVTSPQAFQMLREKKLTVPFPNRTFATVDHIIPTDVRSRPLQDPLAENMFKALEQNTADFNIPFFNEGSGRQGVVHVIGPELGLTLPGMTIACGDSHTSTHGAFGSIAFGVGTSQVRDVLATQTLIMSPLKVRRVKIEGELSHLVTAKDVALYVINKLGVEGGVGFAYEFAGSTVENMSMEERMTLCNMSIEGGARCGYINPDETTFAYLKGKPYVPKDAEWDQSLKRWAAYVSDSDAVYDDEVTYLASDIQPMVTWGINPEQGITIDAQVPHPDEAKGLKKALTAEALKYMQLTPGQAIKGTPINVAFIGSCTNGRLSDFESVAAAIKGKQVSPSVRAIAVPGSEEVDRLARAKGLHKIFESAGFEWRKPGCSMCLAMNPDQLKGDEVCASSSNRNFKGRQGSSTGRTILMSPVMVAASAIKGHVADPREVFK